MANSDFKQTAEKYKKEMMRLYGNSISSNKNTSAETHQENTVKEENAEIPAASENKEEIQNENKEAENIDEKFPPPELPDFIRGISPVNNSYGYLKVNVKTGNGGLPLEDSIVTVSKIIDGKEYVIKMMSTDSSGSTEILRLPAPSKPVGNAPQDYEHFAKYNVSAFSKGYFRETSVDLPVFENITSIQNFYLIPEPFDYNSGERTIVDRNPEPLI